MKKILSACCVLGCLGCGGPQPITEVGNPTVSVPPVAGTVTKGPVQNAQVTVYRLTSDGQLGEVLFTTQTGPDGKFTITAPLSGPFAAVATGGSYKDEATSKTVEIPDGKKLTLWSANSQAPTSLAITPLTSIAASRAARQVGSGLESAIAEAQKEVQKLFRLEGIDLETTLPDDVTGKSGIDKNKAGNRYGLALAGLTQLTKRRNLDPSLVLDLIDNIASDFSDGILDAKEDGEPLETELSFTPDEALQELEAAEAEFEKEMQAAQAEIDQAMQKMEQDLAAASQEAAQDTGPDMSEKTGSQDDSF